jgi:uncharacterized protein
MNRTFLDTSFFLALSLEDDALHDRALAWQRAITGKLFTSEFVLLEVADHLSSPHLKRLVSAIFSFVHEDEQITSFPISREDYLSGIVLFDCRPDKQWSLTDCISFEIMRTHGITEALTHDHHFEQAGFRALLRQDPPSN